MAPAELEFLIAKHPGVKDVGVVGKPDERAGEVPLAFVVKKDVSITEKEIVDFVAGKHTNLTCNFLIVHSELAVE